MGFFEGANVVVYGNNTFQETHGDQHIYNGNVYNYDSFNTTTTTTEGSHNDSSTSSNGSRRNRPKFPANTMPRQSAHSFRTVNPTSRTPSSHRKSPYPTSPSPDEIRRHAREAAERVRRMHLNDEALPHDFHTPRTTVEEVSDDEDSDNSVEEIVVEETQPQPPPAANPSSTRPASPPSSTRPQSSPPPPRPQRHPGRAANPAFSRGGTVHNFNSGNMKTNITTNSNNDTSICIVEEEDDD